FHNDLSLWFPVFFKEENREKRLKSASSNYPLEKQAKKRLQLETAIKKMRRATTQRIDIDYFETINMHLMCGRFAIKIGKYSNFENAQKSVHTKSN
ncbi:hypothetical protein P5E91_15520, partial [Clostridium perfringens]|nr:hypothetical protein [Clostridium perfringens]